MKFSSHKCHHSENFCSAAFERSPNAEYGWTHVYVYNRIAHCNHFSHQWSLWLEENSFSARLSFLVQLCSKKVRQIILIQQYSKLLEVQFKSTIRGKSFSLVSINSEWCKTFTGLWPDHGFIVTTTDYNLLIRFIWWQFV